MPTTGYALLGGAVVVFALGAWVLWSGRVRRAMGPAPSSDGARSVSLPMVGRVSEPTRLLIGVVCILAAYHLGVWAFPPDLTPMQFPRRWWWILGVGSVVTVGMSVWMDVSERRRGP